MVQIVFAFQQPRRRWAAEPLAQHVQQPPLQRLGLSATQRPPAEAARLLGGFDAATGEPRPVTIIDAGQPKVLELRVELPGHPDPAAPPAEVDAAATGARPAASAWPAIHARLLELVRAHRTTMIFVNSRRLAERRPFDLGIERMVLDEPAAIRF